MRNNSIKSFFFTLFLCAIGLIVCHNNLKREVIVYSQENAQRRINISTISSDLRYVLQKTLSSYENNNSKKIDGDRVANRDNEVQFYKTLVSRLSGLPSSSDVSRLSSNSDISFSSSNSDVSLSSSNSDVSHLNSAISTLPSNNVMSSSSDASSLSSNPVLPSFSDVSNISSNSGVAPLSSNLDLSQSSIDSGLRYVAFGTSVTYGSGLKDPDNQTYIKLLSQEGLNLGIRASDPSYPAMCTQTMVGSNIYDVIIIEYDRRFEDGLSNLVRRLRQRFPKAAIIALQTWTFNMLLVNGNDMFLKYLKAKGYEHNSEAVVDFVSDLNVDDLDIEFNSNLAKRTDFMNQLEKDYNIIIYRWESTGDMKELILKHLPLNAKDWVHLSEAGHKFVADGIRKILADKGTQRINDVGSWGDGDVCTQWIDGGKMDNNAVNHIRFSAQHVSMDIFHPVKGYYALTFKFSSAMAKVWNTFDGPRQLAFTYMATGPIKRIYPKVYVKIAGSEPVIIDPFDTYYDYPVHIQLTKEVGLLKPGVNDIVIRTLEKTESPFRLIGFTITNGEDTASRMFSRKVPLLE